MTGLPLINKHCILDWSTQEDVYSDVRLVLDTVTAAAQTGVGTGQ